MLKLLLLLVLVGLSKNTEECKEVPLEIMFVMDSSGSVGQQNFTVMKNFVKSTIERLHIGVNGTHVGVITFSGYPVHRIHLTEYVDQASLENAVDAIPYIAGITETNRALDMLVREGFDGARAGLARVGVVITDGKSFHPTATAASAQTAQNQGITLFAVGIGPDVNLAELQAIATDPDVPHIFRTDNFDSLQNIVTQLSDRTCQAKYIATNVTLAPPPNTVTQGYINSTQNASEVCNETLADILFILDSSGSLGPNNFQLVRQFVINIINDLDIGENLTSVGVITFSSYPTMPIHLGQYDSKLDLINAVNQIKYYSGGTATDAALDFARIEGFKGDRQYAPNIAIVVTDGHSTAPSLTKTAAASLKQAGTTVFAVGVGAEIDINELNSISSAPNSGYVFFVTNFTELASIEKNVAKTTCEVPLYPGQLVTIEGTGRTTMETVRTTNGPGFVTAVEPVGTTPQPCIAKVADVIFVIDSSGSVGQANFETIKNFIKQMIDVFDVSNVYTRVGVIKYNIAATVQFGLNKYNTSDLVKQAVDNIQFTSGGTNTGLALETLRVSGFLNERPGVPNIAIVITDGLSSDPIATKVQARLLKENGDFILAIGVGNQTNIDELKAIASVDQKTGANLVYEVGSFQALRTLNSTVAHQACTAVVNPGVTLSPSTTQVAVTKESCADTIDNCAAYGIGMCSDYKPWATAHCKAFCRICTNAPTTPPPPCVDDIPNCFEYGSYICTTVSVIAWTKAHCPLYCKFCAPSGVNATATAIATATGAHVSMATGSTAAPPSVSGKPVTSATGATAAPASVSGKPVTSATGATAAPASVSGEPVTSATGATAAPASVSGEPVTSATGATAAPASVSGEPVTSATGATAAPASVSGEPVTSATGATAAPASVSGEPVTSATGATAAPASVSGEPVTSATGATAAPASVSGEPVTSATGATAAPASVSGEPVTSATGATAAPASVSGEPVTSATGATAAPASVSGEPVTSATGATAAPASVSGKPVTSATGATAAPASVSGEPVTSATGATAAPASVSGEPVTSATGATAAPASVSGEPVTSATGVTAAPASVSGEPVTSTTGETAAPASVSGEPVTPVTGATAAPASVSGEPVTSATGATAAPASVSGEPVTSATGATVAPASVSGEPVTSATRATAAPASVSGEPVTSATGATAAPASVSGEPVTSATGATAAPASVSGEPVTSATGATAAPASVSGEPVTSATGATAAPASVSGEPVTSATGGTAAPASVSGEPVTSATGATAAPASVSGQPVTSATGTTAAPASVSGKPVTSAIVSTAAPASVSGQPVTVATGAPTGPVSTGETTAPPSANSSTTPLATEEPVTLATGETPSPPTTQSAVSTVGPVSVVTEETAAPQSTTPSATRTASASGEPITVATGATAGSASMATGETTAQPSANPSITTLTTEVPVTLATGKTPSQPTTQSVASTVGPISVATEETAAPQNTNPSATPVTQSPKSTLGGPVSLATVETPAPQGTKPSQTSVTQSPMSTLGGPVSETSVPQSTNPSAQPVVTEQPVTKATGETPSPPTAQPQLTTLAPVATGQSVSSEVTTAPPPLTLSPTGGITETVQPVSIATGATHAPASESTTLAPIVTGASVGTTSTAEPETLPTGATPSSPAPGLQTVATTQGVIATHAPVTGEPVSTATGETAAPPSVSMRTQSTAVTNSPITETPASVSAPGATEAPTTSRPVITGKTTAIPPIVGQSTETPNSPPSPKGTVSTLATQPGQATTIGVTGQPSPTGQPITNSPATQTSPSTQSCASRVADLIFVIDSSGSVGLANFGAIKDFIKQSIRVFDIGTEYTRIGVITYSTQPTLEFGLNVYNKTADIETAIDRIPFSAGSTNTGAALQMLRLNGFKNDRPRVPNIAIVITDGLSNDRAATNQQARLAKESGNILIAIGVGNQTDKVELTNIGSVDKDTGVNLVYEVGSYQDLQTVENTILRYACNVAAATNPPPVVVSTSAPISTNTTQVTETCFDTVSNCDEYGRGVCYDYKSWSGAHCNLYCGFCTPQGGLITTEHPCVDAIANCQDYGTYICTSNELISWTKKNCYKYCGLCDGGSVPTEPPTPAPTTEPVCRNKLSNCNEYGGKSMCTNSRYTGWAHDNCREYCGFCIVYNTVTGPTLTNNKTCPDWRLPSECKLVQKDDSCCPLPECPAGYLLTVKAPNED